MAFKMSHHQKPLVASLLQAHLSHCQQSFSGGTLIHMTIEELESAVLKLAPGDLSRFSEWFEEFMAEQWDRRIEGDIKAGKFIAAGKRADSDFEAGRCSEL